jgi:hypothetical protein
MTKEHGSGLGVGLIDIDIIFDWYFVFIVNF